MPVGYGYFEIQKSVSVETVYRLIIMGLLSAMSSSALCAVEQDTRQSWMINNDNNSSMYSDGTEQSVDVTLQGQPIKDFNVLLGINYSILEGESIESIWRKSAFVQADYLFTEKQKITVGWQWNKPEESGGDFSPRIGFYSRVRGTVVVEVVIQRSLSFSFFGGIVCRRPGAFG